MSRHSIIKYRTWVVSYITNPTILLPSIFGDRELGATLVTKDIIVRCVEDGSGHIFVWQSFWGDMRSLLHRSFNERKTVMLDTYVETYLRRNRFYMDSKSSREGSYHAWRINVLA